MSAPAGRPDAVAASSRWRGELEALLHLATPIVLARLGIMVMGLTDAVVVGRFSARELGYHALGWVPTNIVLATGVGLLSGVQVMTARRMGEGRPERAPAVLRRGIVYALQLGALATLAIGLGAPPLLATLGLEADLAQGSGRAAQVFALSLTPYLLATALTYHLEALGRTAPGLIGMWAANVLNVGLNLLFVPGTFGLPAMGAVGAGWATLGARSALLAWLAVAVLRTPQTRPHHLLQPLPPEPGAAAEQRRIGYGAGASVFAEVAAFAGMNVIAAWISALAVAAWAVFLNISAVIFMIPLGLAGAAAVRVGRAYGAQDTAGVFRAAVTASGLAAAVAGVVALLTWPAAGLLAGAYATDPALRAASAAALALGAVFFIPDALQVVLANVQRARGDVALPTLIHVSGYVGVMLPLGWWLAHRAGLGLLGCVWAVIVTSVLVAGLLILRLLQTSARDRTA
jgi:MATE family multidrug resistance protein